jgi:hypothetical protein
MGEKNNHPNNEKAQVMAKSPKFSSFKVEEQLN